MSVEIETSSTWFAHMRRLLSNALMVLAPTSAFAEPSLLYSTYYGGSGFEDARAVTTDSAGNIYVVGATGPGSFPGQGELQSVYGGGTTRSLATNTSLVFPTLNALYGTQDAFVRRYSPLAPKGAVGRERGDPPPRWLSGRARLHSVTKGDR